MRAAVDRTLRGSTSLGTSMVVSVAGNVLTLGLTVFTGVVTARLLGPDGRGQVAAIIAWAMIVQILSSLGFKEALAYLQAKDPDCAPRLLGTTFLLVLGLGTMGVVVSQLLLPVAFGDQAAEVVRVARVFVLMALPIMAHEAMYCLANGHQRFIVATWALIAQPFVLAVGLAVLWGSGRLGVATVLAAQAVSYAVVAAAMATYLARLGGLGPPSARLGRAALRYGVRVQGNTLGSVGNVGLDMLVLPAVVAASQIGLYSVAISAASIIVALFGGLKPIVFSVATRRGSETGMAVVERTLRLTLAGTATIALGLGTLAPLLIELLYGVEFLGAVGPMRLLLPGLTAWTAAMIVTGGLNAVNKPARASLAQVGGMLVTGTGLLTLLPRYGITGAALTSTLAYTTVFALQLRFLDREPDFSVRRALSPRLLVTDVSALAGRGREVVVARAPWRRPQVDGAVVGAVTAPVVGATTAPPD